MNKLLPFNLEKALSGTPIVKRNGKKIIEHHYFKSLNGNQKFICIDEDGDSAYFTDKGTYLDDADESEFDLFLLPETKKIWANVYKNLDGYFIGTQFESEHEAKSFIDGYDGYHATVCIEFEV